MKQDDIIQAYKKIVDLFNATDAAIRDMVRLLPDAPEEEGQPPHKMITADMQKCLYVGSTHMEDGRLRIGAVFQDMLRHSEEFAMQAMAHQGADGDGDIPAPDFTPKAGAPDGDS